MYRQHPQFVKLEQRTKDRVKEEEEFLIKKKTRKLEKDILVFRFDRVLTWVEHVKKERLLNKGISPPVQGRGSGHRPFYRDPSSYNHPTYDTNTRTQEDSMAGGRQDPHSDRPHHEVNQVQRRKDWDNRLDHPSGNSI